MNYLYIVLFAIIILMLVKSISSTKNLKKDSTYVNTYIKILKNEEDGEECLEKYIAQEQDKALLGKAKVVKVYLDMVKDINPSLTLDEIEFDKFLDIPIEKIVENSDVFVWLLLDLSIARSKSMIDIMNKIYTKVTAFEVKLNNLVEYRVFKAGYEAMLEKGYDSISFLSKLLAGEYSDCAYDKQLIGVFKKLATAILVYTGEPVSEEYEEMLKDFVQTQVGNKFMTNLGIADKYYVKNEITNEEVKDEDNKENSEDTKQE